MHVGASSHLAHSPQSRGHVRIKSTDPFAAPAMQPNYLSAPGDRATIVRGVKLARKLAATRALAPYVLGEYRPGPEATTDEDLLAVTDPDYVTE